MATFEPDLDLFEEQVRSLRAQSDSDWTCVISDDCSAPERFEQIRAVVGDDPRFRVSRSDRRLGFYRNFERAIGLAPPETELFALADQDDVWHPDKLAVLRAALDGGTMAFSDLRLVDSAGRVFRATLWRGRRCNHTNLASMLVANSVTGAAMLFRREVAELALPFPDTPGLQFHDHWLAVVALSAGDVAYVERPLYDYVQHAGAVFGDVTHGARHRPPPPLERWRGAYFYGYLAREVQAQTLLLRCVGRLTPRKRRALQAFVDAQRSLPAFLWLAVRPLRAVVGRTETLGSETELAAGIIWKWLIGRLGRGDASFPPPTSFSQKRLRRWRASLAVGTRRRRATR